MYDLYDVPEDKIHVIYNGIDLDQYKPTPASRSANLESILQAFYSVRRSDHPPEGIIHT